MSRYVIHTLPRVVFLQLPQLDNDVAGPQENLHLAAAYLRHAAVRAGLSRSFRFTSASPELEMLDDRHYADALLRSKPTVIAATLYLWNIERTLRILHLVKTGNPAVKIAVGGPETAADHPFLFHASHLAAVCIGEGESVFPAILRAFQGGPSPDFTTVFWNDGRRFAAGRTTPPPVDLNRNLPPPGDPHLKPDRRGMVYLETVRGCPLRCAYCRYPHLRATMSFLEPARVIERIKRLQAGGAREIRIIDPTFNAHPDFETLLENIATINGKTKTAFFAELRAETLTPRQADLLTKAHFTEVEIGVQSRDPKVLRTIHRSTDLAALARGVHLLTRHGIRATVDIMYGLPNQTVRDVKQSLRWAAGIKRVNPQCMQTLLLPGTELRARRTALRLRAADTPPYGMIATATMGLQDMREIEQFLDRDARLRSDCRTACFVGRRLPDLFPEQVTCQLRNQTRVPFIRGRTNRRAIIVSCSSLLFDHRQALVGLIRTAIDSEPEILWQFVLAPATEEPLDLLAILITEIKSHPPRLIDRYGGIATKGLIASRRILIQLPPRRRLNSAWIVAVEDILAATFL